MQNNYDPATVDKIKKFHDDTEKEAGEKVKHFNKKYDFKKDPTSVVACFSLKPTDLSILLGIPDFQGINIYLGLDDKEGEVLILVPAIKGSIQNLYSLTYSANESATTTTESTIVTLKSGQCPPPPPGCTTCLCT